MKKRILYFSDYKLNEYNSVRDILYNLINHSEMKEFHQEIARVSCPLLVPIDIESIEGITTYSTYPTRKTKLVDVLKKKKYNIFNKFLYIVKQGTLNFADLFKKKNSLFRMYNNNYIKKVIKKSKPDLIVFFTYTPNKRYADICIDCNIPYIYMLYDTFIARPDVDIKSNLAGESYVMEHSQGYFVPSFFFDKYTEYYKSDKLIKYDLPLLIDKLDVLKAYDNPKQYLFTYFGQIQSFRNSDNIKQIFHKITQSLDIFTTQNIDSDETFKVHPAVTKDELYSVVAGSKFLVAFDNSVPYNEYLPSKVYLYASFTKPVIAFGDNDTSALRTFFKDYPYFYYQNINESLDGLLEFLNADFPNEFEESVYSDYIQFSPEKALSPIISTISNMD